MLTGIQQSGILLSTIVIFYAMDFALMTHYDRERASPGSGRRWFFTIRVLAFSVLLVVQPVIWPELGVRIEAGGAVWLLAAGIVLVVGGLALHLWARFHLEHFYAERLEVQIDHRVVNTGPYAYVRHPIFDSFFLMIGGLLLIDPALPVLPLVAYTVLIYRGAIREERLLSSRLPDYAAYQAHTGRFLPRLRRARRVA